MFNDFWQTVQYGMNHVLDINAYDHVLFLIVLAVPYLFRDWKRVLFLVTMFTIGHSLSLVLAVYGQVNIKASLIEFLIPITILIVAIRIDIPANNSIRNPPVLICSKAPNIIIPEMAFVIAINGVCRA